MLRVAARDDRAVITLAEVLATVDARELGRHVDLLGAVRDRRGPGPEHLGRRPAHSTSPQRIIVGGFGPWREAIDKVEALEPRHIVAGHQNAQFDDEADRQIAETRQYLQDADELLRTVNTAVDFFDAELERYPDHLGRTVLWAGVSAIYGVREHP